jgi:hypothetical protein
MKKKSRGWEEKSSPKYHEAHKLCVSKCQQAGSIILVVVKSNFIMQGLFV